MLETVLWFMLLTLLGFALGVLACVLIVMYLLKNGENQ